MSQPTQLTPSPAGNILVYRPLSGLAIASLALGAVYAAVVVVSAVVGLLQGSPVFLAGWFLLLPAGGAALSLFATWQIARAEGTLAGTALARWGWWLSLLAGLGYGAYTIATGAAVKKQADQFLMEKGDGIKEKAADSGFFAWLSEGKVNQAFLLTRPYSYRGPVDPDDQDAMDKEFDELKPGERKGKLTAFRESGVISAAIEAGRENNPIQQLGVKGWEYEQGGYKVERSYRITTREGNLDFLVTVRTESERGGEGRKWYVDLENCRPLPTSAATELGTGMNRLRGVSNNYLRAWAMPLQQGAKAAPMPRDLSQWDTVRVPADDPDDCRALARKEIARLLGGQSKGYFGMTIGKRDLSPWTEVDGRLRIEHPFSMPVLIYKDNSGAKYMADGVFFVESKEALDPRDLNTNPVWTVADYRVDRVIRAPEPKAPQKAPQ